HSMKPELTRDLKAETFELDGWLLPILKSYLKSDDPFPAGVAFLGSLLTPFSTEGTNTRSTFWPESDCVNSRPVSRGLGSIRIQTSANCPAPPVCFLWRYFESPLLLIVSR